MTMDIEQVFGLLAQLVVIFGGLAAVYWAFKRWIGDISKDARTAAKQVEPNGGSRDTTRHLIEDIQEGQTELIDRIEAHEMIHERNYELAKEALEVATKAVGIAEHIGTRLDIHLEGHQ